jgi:hypothetical protein
MQCSQPHTTQSILPLPPASCILHPPSCPPPLLVPAFLKVRSRSFADSSTSLFSVLQRTLHPYHTISPCQKVCQPPRVEPLSPSCSSPSCSLASAAVACSAVVSKRYSSSICCCDISLPRTLTQLQAAAGAHVPHGNNTTAIIGSSPPLLPLLANKLILRMHSPINAEIYPSSCR